MKKFYQKINVRDIYQSYNFIPEKELDKTYIRDFKYINSIAVTQNLLDFVEGSALLEASEIIITDHRAILIDINLDSYFKETMSS